MASEKHREAEDALREWLIDEGYVAYDGADAEAISAKACELFARHFPQPEPESGAEDMAKAEAILAEQGVVYSKDDLPLAIASALAAARAAERKRCAKLCGAVERKDPARVAKDWLKRNDPDGYLDPEALSDLIAGCDADITNWCAASCRAQKEPR